MPSACFVCKKVKQIGDAVSFHKFPFHNPELLTKWIKFVERATNIKSHSVRKITKFSSICSQHFNPRDILDNGANSRKSLRRNAVPAIFQRVSSQNPIIVLEEPQENYELCGLCRTLSNEKSLILIDENSFSVMRKCLPFVNFNLSLMQKICCDCTEILNTFSSFIDRVVVAQNIQNQEVSIPRSIKLEPLPEEEQPTLPARASTSQKKCEILEIVDIKPFNFLPFETNALTCEITDQNYEEDEIQILSPKQLKVEINDQEDELELIRKYVNMSLTFMHDHNYVLNPDRNVKTECEEVQQEVSEIKPVPCKICCGKKFYSYKRFLLHKVKKHKEVKRNCCQVCKKKFSSTKSLQIHKKLSCRSNLKKAKENYSKILLELKAKKQKTRRKRPARTSYVCKICNKSFKGSKNLYQHKNATHRKSSYSCKICDKTFKMKHGLRQHIKAQHEKQKLFSCPICGHSFALKGDLKRCRHSDLKKKNLNEA